MIDKIDVKTKVIRRMSLSDLLALQSKLEVNYNKCFVNDRLNDKRLKKEAVISSISDKVGFLINHHCPICSRFFEGLIIGRFIEGSYVIKRYYCYCNDCGLEWKFAEIKDITYIPDSRKKTEVQRWLKMEKH